MKQIDKLRQALMERLALKMHVNPLLFKYYWWVVTESDLGDDCPTLFSISSDGSLNSEWLQNHENRLRQQRDLDKFHHARDRYVKENYERMCFYDAIEYLIKVAIKKKRFIIVKERLPRIGAGSPFDHNHERWKGKKFSPAYHEDTDPVVDEIYK